MPSSGAPRIQVGFRTSIIALFVGIVLFVGLALVYLSFSRVTAITRTAAGSFLDTVAQLSADRIDAQLKTAKDSLDILRGLTSVQSADIANNPRLHIVLAAMLRNNQQLYNLYMGYDDGSFLEMDYIERAGPAGKTRLDAPDGARFRLVRIAKLRDSDQTVSTIDFLSESLVSIRQIPAPPDYDPRKRPWYVDAHEPNASLLTEPYVFFATGEAGYTLRLPISEGRRGVVAGDILLTEAETMLRKQQIGQSGLAFLFDDADRVLVHPDMSRLMEKASEQGRKGDLPHLAAIDTIGITAAINAWRRSGVAQQFFADSKGRSYAAAFRPIALAGSANLRLGLFAPVDEFYAEIEADRRKLFLVAIVFVLAVLPFAFALGSVLSGSLRKLARETDDIQHFRFTGSPQLQSPIREIDELGRSVFTMCTLVQTFANFVPKRLVQQLVETGDPMRLGGVRREVTVLFTDVANFTGLTEKRDPAQVMQFTSRYFAALSEAIMANKGTVDKFIGDAVMAIWNAPIEDDDHVANACAAVLACIEANRQLNAEFEREGWPAYHTRFGLHVGDAVVGNIGSRDRMNYTALGASINLAARLESLNKNYQTTALVSEAVKQRADARFVFRSVDRIKPKGFAAQFEVYELVGATSGQHAMACSVDRQEKPPTAT
jgi:adenylate cyclase